MKYNTELVEWFIRKFCIIKTKIENNIPLRQDEEYLYYILDEYDFYAPKNIQNHNNL